MSAAPLRPARPARFAAVLDAGSSKTVCLIAALDNDGNPARIAGVGEAPSQGIKSGTIVDLAAAENVIRAAVAQAESMAGVRLDRIDLLVNCGAVASRTFAATVQVSAGVIRADTIDRLLDAGRASASNNGRRLLQLDAGGYRLDDGPLMIEVAGLPARRIAAHFCAVTADKPAIANLTRTVSRCYLAPRSLVPGPLASAWAVTSDDERRHGVLVIDIGAEVTGFAMLRENRTVYASTIPIGGAQVTIDIAHALRTPLEEAERIKALYGTVLIAQSDQHDVFTHAVTGHGESFEQRSTKADLARIIQARMAHLFHLVRDQLANAGLLEGSTARIVLCGGGSEIPGLQSFAEGVYRRPVREGRPQPISGLPPRYASAAFAGAVGVLRAVADSAAGDLPGAEGADQPRGYIGRVGQWLKDGF